MSRRKQKRSWDLVAMDRKALLAAGYEIREMTPWHWHVRDPEAGILVNVWPTAGKYMPEGANGSNPYNDIIKALAGLFKSMRDVGGAHQQRVEQKKAQAEVEKMRSMGLDYFNQKK